MLFVAEHDESQAARTRLDHSLGSGKLCGLSRGKVPSRHHRFVDILTICFDHFSHLPW